MATSRDEVILDVNVEGDEELQRTTKSIDELREANKKLREERNKLKPVNDEAKAQLAALNAELDKNNKIIKNNSDELAKQKINVGNYKNSIVDAWKEIKKLEYENAKLEKTMKSLDRTTKEGADKWKVYNTAIQNNVTQINNYQQSVNNSIDNTKIFGNSIGDLKESFSALLNPITGTIAVLGALTAAYVSSAAGAEDLRKAQNNLKALGDTLSNNIGQAGSADGSDNGILTRLGRGTRRIGTFLNPFNAGYMSSSANNRAQDNAGIAAEELKYQQELEVAVVRAQANYKVFEREAEQYRKRRDDAEASFTERLEASKGVEVSMIAAGKEKLIVLEAQRKSILSYLEATGGMKDGEAISLETRKQIASLDAEIADVNEDINGKLTENLASERAITKEIGTNQIKAREELFNKMIEGYRRANEAREKEEKRQAGDEAELWKLSGGKPDNPAESFRETEEMRLEDANRFLDKETQQLRDQLAQHEKMRQEAAKKRLQIAQFEANAESAVGQLVYEKKKGYMVAANMIFKRQALAETFTNTYAAAVAAFKALAGIPIVGPVLGAVAAAGVTAFGLLQVANISGISFARGGKVGNKRGTFGGNYHSNGGNKYMDLNTGHTIEVERDENFYVLNRGASAEINNLSHLNQKHGGRSFGQRTFHAALGGQIVTREAAMQPVAVSAQSMPPVIVTVEDINAGLERKYDTDQRAKVL